MIDDLNRDPRDRRLAHAAAMIKQVEKALARELGNSGSGCPDWLADIYMMLDAALQSLGDPPVSAPSAVRLTACHPCRPTARRWSAFVGRHPTVTRRQPPPEST